MDISLIHIGGKMICQNDIIPEANAEKIKKDFPNWVKRGHEYTVRDILVTPYTISVLFEEIENPKTFMNSAIGEREAGFNFFRFVPSMAQGKAGNYIENNL